MVFPRADSKQANSHQNRQNITRRGKPVTGSEPVQLASTLTNDQLALPQPTACPFICFDWGRPVVLVSMSLALIFLHYFLAICVHFLSIEPLIHDPRGPACV